MFAQLALLKDNSEIIWVTVYTFLALFTRLYRIGKSNTVVWDEAHFGKFGAYYLNQTFYFDVHPPLGKMLVGLAGALSGFNGSFDFPSGAVYPEHVPFKSMRIMLALPGIAMVPLAWGTAYEFRFTERAKHLVTLMTLCGGCRPFNLESYTSMLIIVSIWLSRHGLDGHLPLHPPRLDAPLLHLHNSLLPRMFSQSATVVSVLTPVCAPGEEAQVVVLVPSPRTGGYGSP
jgi:hypothetical protein